MAAAENTIMQADLAKVRVVDFNYRFVGDLRKFFEALGVTEKIAVQEGATIKALKVTGTLESGSVEEGDLIPLSHYETEEVSLGEVTLNKWRKSTTAEAIIKGGYDQAVGKTTEKMLKDIQRTIRSNFFGFLATGTAAATGATLQPALANGWGRLQVLFEDDAIDSVFFLNPLDVSEYLGTAQITTQTVFGMSYIENFLGLGSVFLNSNVPQGKYYATAKENIKTYFVNVGAGNIAEAFDLTTDETGYIGISEYPDKDHACVNDLVMSGVTFFPERIDGIVVGTIGEDAGDSEAGGDDEGGDNAGGENAGGGDNAGGEVAGA